MKKIIFLFVCCLFFLIGCQREEKISLDEMQYCENNDDCVYADNSCCPKTMAENIIPINSQYYDYYMSIGKDCEKNYDCIERFVWPAIDTLCVENKCTGGDDLIDFIKDECAFYCLDNDKESWDNNYLTTKSVGVGSACDIIYEMEEFFPYKWMEEEGTYICYEVAEDDTEPPEE